MRTVNVHEAKSTLSHLLRLVEEEGEHIRIARNGHAIAEVVPINKRRDPLQTDPLLQGETLEDPMLPLDPEDWGMED